MGGSASRPVEIELDRTRELRIRWEDGEVSVYPLSLLRRSCPCAACRSDQVRAGPGRLPLVLDAETQRRMVIAERLELVGHYGLRITWKDGHSEGIYDYELLRALASGQKDEDSRS